MLSNFPSMFFFLIPFSFSPLAWHNRDVSSPFPCPFHSVFSSFLIRPSIPASSHYDPDSGRSVLCRLRLDASCATISWQRLVLCRRVKKTNRFPRPSSFHRIYYGGRDGRERELMAMAAAKTANLQSAESGSSNRLQGGSSSMAPRPPGACKSCFAVFFFCQSKCQT